MTNRLGLFASAQLHGEPVRELLLSVKAQDPVAVAVGGSGPEPALVMPAELHARPEVARLISSTHAVPFSGCVIHRRANVIRFDV